MNLSLYNPPDQWTENLILEISDEDNRFEFKSGEQWLSSELEKKIAKEICALANSFGGTLFLGIEDRTKEIVGVPKTGKGRASAKAWIESLIPNLLEFRLPNFRVLEVSLNPETKTRITDQRTVISIDVYDSDLAPHRSTKDQIYYYRQSSQSIPAPHHYLAYLWGRTSPNMSFVVNSWFKVYVNNLIYLLEITARNFNTNKFNVTDEAVGVVPVHIRKIVFFSNDFWKPLNSSLTAKQFLRTFPSVGLKAAELNSLIETFFSHLQTLDEIIDSSPEFERQMRKFYDKLMYKEGFRQPHQFDDKSFEEVLRLIAGQAFNSSGLKSLGENPAELREILVRFTSYNLLNLESSLMLSSNPILFDLCRKEIANHFNESKEKVEKVLQQVIKSRKIIAKKAESLANEVEELRYALASKHNTTFE